MNRVEGHKTMQWLLKEASYEETRHLLTTLDWREVSAAGLAGFVDGMMEEARKITPKVKDSVDTCGTGGTGTGIFNESTAGAVVTAAAGVYVAKHGNRSVSSTSGSADVLEASGYHIDMSPEDCKTMIELEKIGFLYARTFHPAMAKVAPVRKEIGTRTIFNILGPWCNPAGATSQLLGVYDKSLCQTSCDVLAELGVPRALVVYGTGPDGISVDAISNMGETTLYELDNTDPENPKVTIDTVVPEDFGFTRCTLADLVVSSPEESAMYMRKIFEGWENPRRDIAVLNTGIYIGGGADSIEEGIKMAHDAIDSGDALRKWDSMIQRSNEFRK